jgi:hypothetical protein
LRCLFYGPIAPSVGSRKGIITYKTTNGISILWKHLELLHQQLWSEWVHLEKDGLNAKKQPSKERFGSTPSNISNFFISTTPYSKEDSNEKQFEKDLALFIAKELVPLTFVHVPFFKRLMMKHNPCFIFPYRQALVFFHLA